MKRWFDVRAQAHGAEIVIYDEIGAFGIPAKAFLDDLQALGSVPEITLRINSPGGSVASASKVIPSQPRPRTTCSRTGAACSPIPAVKIRPSIPSIEAAGAFAPRA